MTHDEQHRMILELLDYSYRFGGRDKYDFEMFLKRDKDDEDLDTISQKRLQGLHDQYVVRKSKI
jgi:hypothetical protein